MEEWWVLLYSASFNPPLKLNKKMNDNSFSNLYQTKTLNLPKNKNKRQKKLRLLGCFTRYTNVLCTQECVSPTVLNERNLGMAKKGEMMKKKKEGGEEMGFFLLLQLLLKP